MKGWIEKTLSTACKEVLVNSVAQAVPVFSMSCFKLPRGLCEHLNKLIRQFWWGSKEGKRKPAWVAWKSMTKFMGRQALTTPISKEHEEFLLGHHETDFLKLSIRQVLGYLRMM